MPQRISWFHLLSIGIFGLFMSIMLFAICFAYMRKSGSTGLDMGKVQQLRRPHSIEAKDVLTVQPN